MPEATTPLGGRPRWVVPVAIAAVFYGVVRLIVVLPVIWPHDTLTLPVIPCGPGYASSLPTPDGWTRTGDRTFRRGDVVGEIRRINVPPHLSTDQNQFNDFYERVAADEMREAGGRAELLKQTHATPLSGYVGVYYQFAYSAQPSTDTIRIDHVMHPTRGGCGWHFRAVYPASFDQRSYEAANMFPDRFDFPPTP